MPLGFERINERVKRPNPLINFIRTLPGSSSHYAQDFLERIAAQCYPIMKANHIAVMALEEYEWNQEFIGRNFNAGEVIQLVLRSRNGAWMPFKHVQMVMMHELAHCKQMNHSKAFWRVRDSYAGELRMLWSKSYTGEGLWGRGQTVLTGEYTNNVMPDSHDLPEHTCGGTFRSSRRKRKRGGAKERPKVSYAERQQKRILKKFGTGGVALGDDEDVRIKLEEGKKKIKGKPRVAGNARGRDLRAAAALSRFEQAKSEDVKKEELESESEDEYDWPSTDDEAVSNQDNEKVVDGTGHNMVRVCDVEDDDDEDVKREMQDLLDLDSIPDIGKKNGHLSSRTKDRYNGPNTDDDDELPELFGKKKTDKEAATKLMRPKDAPITKDEDDLPKLGISNQKPTLPAKRSSAMNYDHGKVVPGSKSRRVQISLTHHITQEELPRNDLAPAATISKKPRDAVTSEKTGVCPCCSFANEPSAIVCLTCSNVLNRRAMPNHWRCQSDACRGGDYVNMGDYGLCQICGSKKP